MFLRTFGQILLMFQDALVEKIKHLVGVAAIAIRGNIQFRHFNGQVKRFYFFIIGNHFLSPFDPIMFVYPDEETAKHAARHRFLTPQP